MFDTVDTLFIVHLGTHFVCDIFELNKSQRSQAGKTFKRNANGNVDGKRKTDILQCFTHCGLQADIPPKPTISKEKVMRL